MHFQIESDGGVGFTWRLVAKHGDVCKSARSFKSEAEARGDIADAKRSMGAARYTKVQTSP